MVYNNNYMYVMVLIFHVLFPHSLNEELVYTLLTIFEFSYIKF